MFRRLILLHLAVGDALRTSRVRVVVVHLPPLSFGLVPLESALDLLLPVRAEPDDSVLAQSDDE